jgi:hypothetical protein
VAESLSYLVVAVSSLLAGLRYLGFFGGIFAELVLCLVAFSLRAAVIVFDIRMGLLANLFVWGNRPTKFWHERVFDSHIIDSILYQCLLR